MMPRGSRCLVVLAAVSLLGSVPFARGAVGAEQISSVMELHQLALDAYRAAFDRETAQREKIFALGRAGTDDWRIMNEERDELNWLTWTLVAQARKIEEGIKGLAGFERWFENEVVQTPGLASGDLSAKFEGKISAVGEALRVYAAAVSKGTRAAVEENRAELTAEVLEFALFCEKLKHEVAWKMWRAEWSGYKDDPAVAERIRVFDEKCAAYGEAQARFSEQSRAGLRTETLREKNERQMKALLKEVKRLAQEVNKMIERGGKK